MSTTNYHALAVLIAIVWSIGIGVWAERHRFGGTHDLRDKLAEVERQKVEALELIDEMVVANAAAKGMIDPASVPPPRRRLRVVGGRP